MRTAIVTFISGYHPEHGGSAGNTLAATHARLPRTLQVSPRHIPGAVVSFTVLRFDAPNATAE
jgi:hypothetical protein